MIRRDDLLAWMRQPTPPAAVSLCLHCNERPAIATDGEPTTCRPCAMRLTHLAFFPSLFDETEVAAHWEAHKDVLELAQLPADAHMVVSQSIVKICQHFKPGWRWTAPWPVEGEAELVAPEGVDRVIGEAYQVAVGYQP